MKEQVCPLNIKSWVDKNNLSYDEGHSFIGAHAGSIVKQQKNDRIERAVNNTNNCSLTIIKSQFHITDIIV